MEWCQFRANVKVWFAKVYTGPGSPLASLKQICVKMLFLFVLIQTQQPSALLETVKTMSRVNKLFHKESTVVFFLSQGIL